ncbi:hypothetical protein EVAR_29869_1 [Eumeta japonica]|uniref:Uncharacterized protein n=1 Tax=Eumeta variegata TaxID=151549 RepID=A0A4C1V928_EUMVA|nr:hypothetical protein EVAR_29869_1 [Eumeta japonica]
MKCVCPVRRAVEDTRFSFRFILFSLELMIRNPQSSFAPAAAATASTLKTYTDGRAISSHHPWMRVAGCNTNIYAHSCKRPAPLKRIAEVSVHFGCAVEREGSYFLSYAAPAVYIPPSYEFSVRCQRVKDAYQQKSKLQEMNESSGDPLSLYHATASLPPPAHPLSISPLFPPSDFLVLHKRPATYW